MRYRSSRRVHLLRTLIVLAIGCESAAPPLPPGPEKIRVPIDAAPRDAPPDASPDATIDPCAACAAGTICVQHFDGMCEMTTRCVSETVKCPDRECSAACATAYCSGRYQCRNRVPCGKESATAFTCYGP